jgi:parvulin-like peptidyl-prolyl isomerase
MNRTAVSILSALVLASSLAFAQQKASSEVLATVGSKKITVDEFNRKYSELKALLSSPAPTKSVFLEDMVRYEVGLQEALRRNLDKDPVIIDRMNQEMYKGMLEKDLGQKVQKLPVSDAEMKAYYKSNPELRASHILIEFKPGATPEQIAEAKKRANEIYEEVKKSKRPFEELVKLYSDDPITKQFGGDVGWISRATVVRSFYDAALSMKINEIKGLVETPLGFHIVKLTGRNTYEAADKSQVRLEVFNEKRKVVLDEYFEKLKKQYPIKVNSALLK